MNLTKYYSDCIDMYRSDLVERDQKNVYNMYISTYLFIIYEACLRDKYSKRANVSHSITFKY
jgi:hypothetical protein